MGSKGNEAFCGWAISRPKRQLQNGEGRAVVNLTLECRLEGRTAGMSQLVVPAESLPLGRPFYRSKNKEGRSLPLRSCQNTRSKSCNKYTPIQKEQNSQIFSTDPWMCHDFLRHFNYISSFGNFIYELERNGNAAIGYAVFYYAIGKRNTVQTAIVRWSQH